jgi:glycosyltransferase involved in cell wall biosynthesis
VRFHYIAPSVLPSRTANSVHVLLQCDGLAQLGADITLYAKRSVSSNEELLLALRAAYGVDASRLRLITYYSHYSRADGLRIAVMALRSMHADAWPEAILSRNLYAAFAIAVLQRRPLIFETHQLEQGARKAMQRAIMRCPGVVTLLISQKLHEALVVHHGVGPRRPLVLHDAAPDGIEPLGADAKRSVLLTHVPGAQKSWDAICGYFGQLHPGRGVEIIERMASARPTCLFVIYGGNEADVRRWRNANSAPNLYFGGHLPHPVALQIMRSVDVLLMPYQQHVSIGVAGHDTARFMSPMKMFEYMASGVPLISSDLPVLREILRSDENALLVPASDGDAWIAALDRLIANPAFSAQLALRSHDDYRENHTWTQRARQILQAAEAL